MKPIQFRGKETMSYNKTEMNSHPDEIKWNGVDYVRKDIIDTEVDRRIKERMTDLEIFDILKRDIELSLNANYKGVYIDGLEKAAIAIYARLTQPNNSEGGEG